MIDNIEQANRKYLEAVNLDSVHHNNVVRMRSWFLHGTDINLESLVIVMDYYPEGNLKKFSTELKRDGFFIPDEEIINHAIQLVDALKFMQSKEICHRDIKPQNILIHNYATTLKIGDFGSSRYLKNAINFSVVGTPIYMSPEMRKAYAQHLERADNSFQYCPYKSDVYSLGLVILDLASLQDPVGLTDMNNLQNEKGTFN